MPYLIDTSVFHDIQNHYPVYTLLSFREWVKQNHQDELVFSVEGVSKELGHKEIKDEIKSWSKEIGGKFYLSGNAGIRENISKISDWVKVRYSGLNYNFLRTADVFLAHGMQLGYTVVTQETFKGQLSKPKIPTACKEFGVDCIKIMEMLEREGYAFVIQPMVKK